MTPDTADILIEALPYIRKFNGMTIVVKYGGHAMVDEQLKADFARDITLLKYVGLNPIIVHGGGPQINEVLDKMGISARFVRGMRMTDAPTMDVVEMVLGGKVNKAVVTKINQQGGRAVGLSGKDGGLLVAKKLKIVFDDGGETPPEIIDPGHVGKVTAVNPAILETLSQKGFIPVISPVGADEDGATYNINADHVASEIAVALSAERLVYLTDVDGVLDENGALISTINQATIRSMIDANTIKGGMIPKIECALTALTHGVEKVPIINGKIRHALLLELFTRRGIGTEVVA
jgi:acetylglutamate kinase